MIYVLNNCEHIINLFDNDNDSTLTAYISDWAVQTLDRQNIREEIECTLPYGDYERLEYILEFLIILRKEKYNENTVCL